MTENEQSETLDPYASLEPLMEAKGATLSSRDFFERVNVVFHDVESNHYDRIHAEMWDVLPTVFSALTEDALRQCDVPASLKALDVGCGTGLGTELLLGTELGRRIRHVDLLDTSTGMLARCAERAEGWEVAHTLVQGTLETLSTEGYDLVLASSVLHHIPDLRSFFKGLERVQAPGGLFLHVQDPNADVLNSPALEARRERYGAYRSAQLPSGLRRLAPRHVLRWLKRTLRGGEDENAYLQRVNDVLLEDEVIRTPLSPGEIWSITDIRVPSACSASDGISLEEIKEMTPDYEVVSSRAYSFFGVMKSHLPEAMAQEEEALFERRDCHGHHLGAVWRQHAG